MKRLHEQYAKTDIPNISPQFKICLSQYQTLESRPKVDFGFELSDVCSHGMVTSSAP